MILGNEEAGVDYDAAIDYLDSALEMARLAAANLRTGSNASDHVHDAARGIHEALVIVQMYADG